ncbi:MAG: hypothetical protein A2X86_16730 [Bdellovibrionales bacterium GWA2_49_15]|nr:MAG: hypothetical protein A2X86_16730 [Bdellovibrionales bacterium GWA2_49_15]
MALSTETIGFRKVDQFTTRKSQLISVLRIVTVETPPLLGCMFEFNVRMLIDKDTWFGIDD